MKRFISISLAILLGLVSAGEIFVPHEPVFLAEGGVPATPTDTTTTTGNIKTGITQKVEEVNEKLQRLNCLLYDDLTFFDLRALESTTGYEVSGSNT